MWYLLHSGQASFDGGMFFLFPVCGDKNILCDPISSSWWAQRHSAKCQKNRLKHAHQELLCKFSDHIWPLEMTEIWQQPFSCVPSEIQLTEPVLKTTEANMFLLNMEHHKCLPLLSDLWSEMWVFNTITDFCIERATGDCGWSIHSLAEDALKAEYCSFISYRLFKLQSLFLSSKYSVIFFIQSISSSDHRKMITVRNSIRCDIFRL